MARFITGKSLNSAIASLFDSARAQIIIISPYIKLHPEYRKILVKHRDNPRLEVTLVFGKNEGNLSKSLNEEDFKFFRDFQNIEIRYEPRLHAKYYANEAEAILSSMNLYEFSQDNNIEAGVVTQARGLKEVAQKLWDGKETLDKQAWVFVATVVEGSKIMFRRVPEFEKGFLGFRRNFKKSHITHDDLSRVYGLSSTKTSTVREVPIEGVGEKNIPAGYCIRTGQRIPFDLSNPLCEKAFQTWAQFGNANYPEKYCHFSGEPSNGKTSYATPILRKNWKKAKELM